MKRYQVTVEEIVDKPSDSLVDAPGTIISWQRAQERVDAGLAVETPVDLNEIRNEWAAVGSETIGSGTPEEYPHWTYRIPLQPSEAVKKAEAGTMTAVELDAVDATAWLLADRSRVVTDGDGDAWQAIGEKQIGCTTIQHTVSSLGNGHEPYTPLLPATRSQVEMERELATARDELAETKASLSTAMDALKKGSCDLMCVYEDKRAAEQQLASALASQKAAEAALDEERHKSEFLRGQLRTVRKWLEHDVDCGKSRDRELYEVLLNNSAGKESGG